MSCEKRSPKTCRRLTAMFLTAAVLLPVGLQSATAADAKTDAATLLKQSGVTGGFIVHLGCSDGKLTAALHRGPAFHVHGLSTDAAIVEKTRRTIKARGIYGNVSAVRLRGTSLPYIDNLVNLLVVETPGVVSLDEVKRVLVPNGVAMIRKGDGWTKIVKPRPKNIDEWSHYLHDSTGNSVAHDDVVGPPRHLQWLGSPRWSRHHDRMASMSALVSAGGRIFLIRDEGSRVSIQMPPKWKLIARDAFNGTILWKRDIPTWHSHLWPLKSGPTQLARRLIATKDRVYATLGAQAPLTEIDAATGKTVRTFDDTKATEEVIHNNGTLFLLVNPGSTQLATFKPKFNVGDQRRVAQDFHWNQKPRRILAIDVKSGKTLWDKTSKVAPLTLAADAKRVCYFDSEKVVCLGRDGKLLWKSVVVNSRKTLPFNFGPRLVIYKDVLLFAGGDRKMASFDLASGKLLWQAPHDKSGYQSPEDLLVSDGLVWSAPTTRTGDTGLFTGRNPRTGEVKVTFSPNVETYWFHHRCYLAKATDRFLLPSRTGIEFVDVHRKAWEIHHWVRGGCLYGVMPCNGFVYAPPHNCACYPEAKLYGFNVLAPASKSRVVPLIVSDKDRLERGPAYGAKLVDKGAETDWPTFRHDRERSAFTPAEVSANLGTNWTAKLGGRLTAPVVAGGRLYVAQIDRHTLHALNAETGKTSWTFTAGGRIDSPPTIDKGRVLFGSADGCVYCLRAADGALIWRYRVAPLDRRTMVFEQLESLWPVHGSVLVQDDTVYTVAGRSNFLDGGLRLIQLDPATGRKRAEAVIGDKDPKTGENIQGRIQVLQMPAGLPDILSSDGSRIFMRSQQFNLQGKRQNIGPVSGQAPRQGAAQTGPGRHLFAAMGYLDESYFHRSYWVYGKSFAGGHNGYYQAGKNTAAGRILASDGKEVFGFARKPQYYKWTTTIEHELFATSTEPPAIKANPKAARRGRRASMVRFTKSKSLNPAGKQIVVEAWVNAARPNGAVLARGGPADGYAIVLKDGRPRFVVRRNGEIFSATARQAIVGKWTHLVGVLTKKKIHLYVNGKPAKSADVAGLLQKDPVQSLEIGADDGGSVGEYRAPYALRGLIDEVRLFHGAMTAADIAARFRKPESKPPKTAELVLAVSFDDGQAGDASGRKNDGRIERARSVAGKFGKALRFLGGGRRGGNRGGGSLVKHRWKRDVPLYVRAILLADKTLFIAGPEDLIDEEQTFKQLVAGDKSVQKLLQAQDDALSDKRGAILWAVSTKDGKTLAELKLPSVPVWDGMASAGGRLFVCTKDGRVICLK
ncbi:MAG: PQQ-binding-like beta-propeller repeat protein [Planctomycetaceae bacterium]